MSQYGELCEPSEPVRRQLERDGHRTGLRPGKYLPAAVPSGFRRAFSVAVAIAAVGVIAVIALAISKFHSAASSFDAHRTTSSAPTGTSSVPFGCVQAMHPPVFDSDAEVSMVSLCMLSPIPNPRTAEVLFARPVAILASTGKSDVGSQCTLYPGGVLFERGDWQGKILAGYRPGGHGLGECPGNIGFWQPESEFPPR